MLKGVINIETKGDFTCVEVEGQGLRSFHIKKETYTISSKGCSLDKMVDYEVEHNGGEREAAKAKVLKLYPRFTNEAQE